MDDPGLSVFLELPLDLPHVFPDISCFDEHGPQVLHVVHLALPCPFQQGFIWSSIRLCESTVQLILGETECIYYSSHVRGRESGYRGIVCILQELCLRVCQIVRGRETCVVRVQYVQRKQLRQSFRCFSVLAAHREPVYNRPEATPVHEITVCHGKGMAGEAGVLACPGVFEVGFDEGGQAALQDPELI